MPEDLTKSTIEDVNKELDELRQFLVQKGAEKGTKSLLKEINTSFIKKLGELTVDLKETIRVLRAIAEKGDVNKQEILRAVQEIKLQPNIALPEVKVNIPPIAIPTVKIPEAIFPGEIEVKGFPDLTKTMAKLLAKETKVGLPYERTNPLPVIITDKSGKYMEFLSNYGSPKVIGPSVVGLKNANDDVINPATAGGVSEVYSQVKKPGTATIYALTMTTANTTYSQVLPANTTMIDVKLRTMGANLLYSWSDWGTYMTIPAGGSRHIENVLWKTARTIYLRSPSASQTAEIEAFSQ